MLIFPFTLPDDVTSRFVNLLYNWLKCGTCTCRASTYVHMKPYRQQDRLRCILCIGVCRTRPQFGWLGGRSQSSPLNNCQQPRNEVVSRVMRFPWTHKLWRVSEWLSERERERVKEERREGGRKDERDLRHDGHGASLVKRRIYCAPLSRRNWDVQTRQSRPASSVAWNGLKGLTKGIPLKRSIRSDFNITILEAYVLSNDLSKYIPKDKLCSRILAYKKANKEKESIYIKINIFLGKKKEKQVLSWEFIV